ncbi:MAG: hypothetical protein WCF22_01520 [Candidatus Sulfotelmatobacter sp.]
MTITWKQYRKACEQSNVEPVRADFKEQQPAFIFRQIAAEQPKAMAANA